MAADVQPTSAEPVAQEGVGESAGQGNGGPQESGGLYDLASVPQELRPFVQEELRKIEGNVTKRFQEHADFREQLGPLAEIEGLTDVPPDDLRELLEFRQLSQDPEQFMGWLAQVNEAVGISPGELDEDGWISAGVENGWFDGDDDNDGGEGQGFDPDQITQSVLEQIQPHLEEFSNFRGEQEQSQRVAAAEQELGGRLEEVLSENGDLDPQDVLELAHGYIAQGVDDPIGQAAEKIMSLRGGAEGALMDRKLGNEWGQSLPAGSADTRPEDLSFDGPDLKKAALARFRS